MSWENDVFGGDDQIFEDDFRLYKEHNAREQARRGGAGGGSFDDGSDGDDDFGSSCSGGSYSGGYSGGSYSGGARTASGGGDPLAIAPSPAADKKPVEYFPYASVPDKLGLDEYLSIKKEASHRRNKVYAVAFFICAAIITLLSLCLASEDTNAVVIFFYLFTVVADVCLCVHYGKMFSWDFRHKLKKAAEVFNATASQEDKDALRRREAKRKGVISALVCIVVFAAIAAFFTVKIVQAERIEAESKDYNSALDLMDKGDYEGALALLEGYDAGFKNVKNNRTVCRAHINYDKTGDAVMTLAIFERGGLYYGINSGELNDREREFYKKIRDEYIDYKVQQSKARYSSPSSGSYDSGSSGSHASGSSGSHGSGSSGSYGSGSSGSYGSYYDLIPKPDTKYFADPEDFYDYYYDDFYDYEEAEEYYYSHGGY